MVPSPNGRTIAPASRHLSRAAIAPVASGRSSPRIAPNPRTSETEERLQARLKPGTDDHGAICQSLPSCDLDGRGCGSARRWVTAKGVAELERVIRIDLEGSAQLRTEDDAAEGQVARCRSLRKDEHVRLDIEGLKAPPVSRPAETADHFVGDEKGAVLVAKAADSSQFAGSGWSNAA